MMNLVNLTPHKLTIYDDAGEKIIRVVEASGTIARVTPVQTEVDHLDGIPVVTTKLAGVEGLPKPQPDTVYVVSSLVAQAVSGRNDVVAPDTGPQSVIRDDEYRIIGVRRFQKF